MLVAAGAPPRPAAGRAAGRARGGSPRGCVGSLGTGLQDLPARAAYVWGGGARWGDWGRRGGWPAPPTAKWACPSQTQLTLSLVAAVASCTRARRCGQGALEQAGAVWLPRRVDDGHAVSPHGQSKRGCGTGGRRARSPKAVTALCRRGRAHPVPRGFRNGQGRGAEPVCWCVVGVVLASDPTWIIWPVYHSISYTLPDTPPVTVGAPVALGLPKGDGVAPSSAS